MPTPLLFTLLLLLAPVARATQAAPTRLVELAGAGSTLDAFELGCTTLAELGGRERLGLEDAGHFEFVLAFTAELAEQIAARERFVAALEPLRSRPSLRAHPLLAAQLEHELAQQLLRLGQARKAAEIYDRLGTVREAWMLGPLDNERGAAFRQTLDVERHGTPIELEQPVRGKARDVRWRLLDIGFSPSRQFDFDSLVRPNEQVCVLLAFVASVETATEVAIRIGSGGSTTVRVNGAEVLRRDAEARRFGFDQDAGTCVLQPGRNLIVVKTGCQEDRFQLRLRLTRPGGSLLPPGLVELSTDPAKLREASATTPADPAPASAQLPSQQMRAGLENAAQLEGDDRLSAAWLAYRLAYLEAAAERNDESNRQDRALAQLATELAPGFGPAWLLLGDALDSSRWSADRDDNARFAAYEHAVQVWPRALEAMLALSQMELEGRHNLHKAWIWLERARAVRPDHCQVLLREIELLQRRSMRQEARLVLEAALREPRLASRPDFLQLALERAKEEHRLADALAFAERSLAAEDDVRMRIEIAELLRARGEYERAEDALRRAIERFPWEFEAYEAMADFYVARERWADAERVWSEYLEYCPDEDYVWLELADLAARRADRPKQIASLERAIELRPGMSERERQLEFLVANEKPFYDGFEVDGTELVRADTGPSEAAVAAKESHEYLLRHTLVRAHADGTASRYEHTIVRVLNERGASHFESYSPSFYGGSQTVRILEARVLGSDGKEQRARLGRTWWVDLPRVRPGDVVELKARIDDRFPSFFGDYFGLEHVFVPEDGIGCKDSRLDVLLEKGRSYHFQRVGDVPEPQTRELDDGTEMRSWRVTGLHGRRVESWAPTARESGPLVRISTYRDWDQFAAWWWDLIRKQTVMTPEIKAQVAALTKGVEDSEERVRRIYEFVTNEVRYKAWEFGVHGYKPYSIAAIYARRHGDCKDKAILLNAMLGEIGVEAFPVLILAEERRERDDLSLPLVEHFNHCISYVPAQKDMPERYLDGTAEYHPLGVLPEMDYGAEVLVVRGHEGHTQKIPWPDGEEHALLWRLDVQLQENGDAIIELEHGAEGFLGPMLRQRFDSEAGKRRERLTDELGALFGKLEIVDMEFPTLSDLSAPARYRLRIQVPGLAQVEAGGKKLRMTPIFRKQQLSSLATSKDREKDMLLGVPSARGFRVHVQPPAGWKFVEAPKEAKFDAPFGSFVFDVQKTETGLQIGSYRVFRTQRIETEDYPRFLEFTRTVDRAENQTLTLEKADR